MEGQAVVIPLARARRDPQRRERRLVHEQPQLEWPVAGHDEPQPAAAQRVRGANDIAGRGSRCGAAVAGPFCHADSISAARRRSPDRSP